MELTESIESINNQLRDEYGLDSNTGKSIFRVVWSNDQFDKLLTNLTFEGLEMLTSRVIEQPKYPWIPDKYILERLVVIPEMNKAELLDANLSYEPIWIFETQLGVYLPPKFEVAKIVCDTLYAALGKRSLRKYVDEEAKNPIEHREMRLKKMHEELFGDETAVGDALTHGWGVSQSGPRFELTESASPKNGEMK